MDDDPIAKSLKTQRLSFISKLSELEREAAIDPSALSQGENDIAEEEEHDDETHTTSRPASPGGVPGRPRQRDREDIGPELDNEEEFRSRPRQRLDRALSFMALNRIPGDDEIYVGGVFALKRPQALKDHGITHILSVLGNMMDGAVSDEYDHYIIELDDMDDEDLLIHLPAAVRYIDTALNSDLEPELFMSTQGPEPTPVPESKPASSVPVVEKSVTDEAIFGPKKTVPPVPESTPTPIPAAVALSQRRNAIYVHCAMGKSRSVSVICAYLMWKYPEYFGLSHEAAIDPERRIRRRRNGHDAMLDAVEWVRRGRDIADPNPGFREQLAMWWEMACPDDVVSHPIYRKWAYSRDVDMSIACGTAPTFLRFEDEEDEMAKQRLKWADDEDTEVDADGVPKGVKPPVHPSLRCKMCRRTLATGQFIIATEHNNPFAPSGASLGPDTACQHYFIEPLSWMKETLQAGELEGRLMCPNARCTSAVGRYSWKGFRCSCSEWVTPAFSLQKSRVDEVKELPVGQQMRKFGIRRPPRTRQNL